VVVLEDIVRPRPEISRTRRWHVTDTALARHWDGAGTPWHWLGCCPGTALVSGRGAPGAAGPMPGW